MSAPAFTTKPIDRIILHIGQHKTGSSSIQQSLYGFDQNGVRYADLGSANQSGKLNALYAPEIVQRKRRNKRGETDEEFFAYVSEMRTLVERELSVPRRTLIFSAEDLEQLGADQVRAMREHMEIFSDVVHVVVFVRSYFSATVSGLQQRVKTGYGSSQFVVKRYRKTLGSYLEVFGKDRMSILPFDPARFVNGSLLRTFLTACDLQDCQVPEVRANESQSDGAIKILYALNRLVGKPFETPAHYRAHNSIRHTISDSIKGAKFSLTPAVAARTTAEPEIAWLRDHVGLDFSADLAGMSPDEATAQAAFQAEMSQIDEASLAQLFDLVEAETGRRTGDLNEALKALFESRLAAVQEKGLKAFRTVAPDGEAKKAQRKETRRAEKAAARAAAGNAERPRDRAGDGGDRKRKGEGKGRKGRPAGDLAEAV